MARRLEKGREIRWAARKDAASDAQQCPINRMLMCVKGVAESTAKGNFDYIADLGPNALNSFHAA